MSNLVHEGRCSLARVKVIPPRFAYKPLSLFIATAFSTAALAQSTGLEEILVEGKPLGQGVSELSVDVARFGTQVQVISADEIATGGFTNFGELAAGLIRGAN